MPDPQSAPGGSIQIAISSSARNGMVGFGVAIEKQPPRYRKLKLKTFSMTLGARSEQNPFSAELAAIAHTLNGLVGLKGFRLRLLTSNKAAALTLQNPRQQSGQGLVCLTYKSINRLRRKGNHIKILWIPTSKDNKLLGLAKEQARAATHEDAIPQAQVSRMKSTTGHHESLVRWYRETRQTSGCNPLRKTHPVAVRSTVVERSERAGPTPDRHGTRKWVSPPSQRCATPNLEAIRTTIRFAIATGRLDVTLAS
ncbi:hypothetical protein ASPFODRAFT_53283 [Aspergillus luchuensis CBS 106.47]|uniref:RNase H type-1 domain-containing protein n=1 Tax=Aspergillus luchuensis (strain CBS 106.47) TaxID=1137211 RepID=A0A1M3T121_ASPLC|nr:hypothetical protein ASPFODRAFT_53283 [Aspergillus luchuensis CBS 106.47]